MKVFIFIFLLSAINLFCAEKIPVLIMFNNCDREYETFIKNGIEDIITKNGYSVIDSQIQENALKEQSKQHKSACYDESCLVDTGKMVAAKYILFIDKIISNETVFYKMKFINIETGENILSKTINQTANLKEEDLFSLGKKFSEEIIIQQSTNNNIEKLKDDKRHQIMIYVNSNKYPEVIKNGVEEILTKKSYSIIDEAVQKEALKEQSEQRKKECYDESCIVETGKMLSAKYLFIINISSVSNGLMFTIKYINTETNEVLLTKSKIFKDDIENTEELFIFAKKTTNELFEENNKINIIEFKTKEEIEKYNAFKKQEEIKLKTIEQVKEYEEKQKELIRIKEEEAKESLKKAREELKFKALKDVIIKIVDDNFNAKTKFADNNLIVTENHTLSPLIKDDEIIKLDNIEVNKNNYRVFYDDYEENESFEVNNITIKRKNEIKTINYDDFIYNSLFKSYFGLSTSLNVFVDDSYYLKFSISFLTFKKKFYEISAGEISVLKNNSNNECLGFVLGDLGVNYKVFKAGIKLLDYYELGNFKSWSTLYGGFKINIQSFYIGLFGEMKYSTKNTEIEHIDFYEHISYDNQEKNGFQFGGTIKAGFNFTKRN